MGTPKTKEHHWTQPSRHTGRSHEMVRDQVRRNPVESREEGEARRLPVQEEGKEVKAAVFTSSSFASSYFARFTTNADGPKLSLELGCISPSFKNRHSNDEHEETKLLFLFHTI